jgi:hypothetical protein
VANNSTTSAMRDMPILCNNNGERKEIRGEWFVAIQQYNSALQPSPAYRALVGSYLLRIGKCILFKDVATPFNLIAHGMAHGTCTSPIGGLRLSPPISYSASYAYSAIFTLPSKECTTSSQSVS